MCKGIDHVWPALLTFLDVPGVEPANNVAGRANRPAVLWRKGSSGTQSGSGARFAGAMLTVAATCSMVRTEPSSPTGMGSAARA